MMKKRVALIVALTMALSLAACGGNQEAEKTAGMKDVQEEESKELTSGDTTVEFVEPEPDEFEYHYDAVYEGVVITAYNGKAQAIRVPAELDGEPVKQVSFAKNGNLTHVELPDSVTVIGKNAFYGCSSLTEIILPDSVTEIVTYAFYECSNLTEIIIPDSVTAIGSTAFSGCSSLTEITIPNGITMISSSTFEGCSNLTKITLPDSVTTIDIYAFRDCSSLTEITLPDGLTELGGSSFLGCTSLRNLTIPEGVAKIKSGTFKGCDGLTITYQGQEYNYANDPENWWRN